LTRCRPSSRPWLKPEVRRERDELLQMVREQLGGIPSFKRAAVVERLPKTRSGKILRGTMRNIADGESYKVPPTIDDPAILPEIENAVAGIGYGRKQHTP